MSLRQTDGLSEGCGVVAGLVSVNEWFGSVADLHRRVANLPRRRPLGPSHRCRPAVLVPTPPSDRCRSVCALGVRDSGNLVPVATPTHATLATFRMDLSRECEQREGLNRMIVPSVSSSPGFVSGTWTLDRQQSESAVLMAFDSLDNAEAFAENVRANAPHQGAIGIELLTIRIVEVSASA